MKKQIEYLDYDKVEICVGTIIDAYPNPKAKKPAYVLKIDFGEKIGIKKSSAQLRENYSAKELINKQIIAVVNFKPKQIGSIMSEVLVLGLPDDKNEPVLIIPTTNLQNGVRLY